MRVKTADNIATNAVNGKFCHGDSGKQDDVRSSNESGSTCI